MKKLTALLSVLLLLLMTPYSVAADEVSGAADLYADELTEPISVPDESESVDDSGNLIMVPIDSAYGSVALSAERDPGEYTTAPNGYAYTAPKVSDNTQIIYDFASLLTDQEIEALKPYLERAENSLDASILVVTTTNTADDPYYDVDTSRAYAMDFYDANSEGLKDDALVFIIDMNNRVIYTVGHGRFADEKYVAFHEKVYDSVLSSAKDGDYYEVIRIFAEKAFALDNVAYAAVPTLPSLLISAGAVLAALLILVGIHEKSEPKSKNVPPVKAQKMQHLRHNVVLTGRHQSVRHIPKNTGGGGGGGGFSGGSFSSGGGGSFSGGGGHF